MVGLLEILLESSTVDDQRWIVSLLASDDDQLAISAARVAHLLNREAIPDLLAVVGESADKRPELTNAVMRALAQISGGDMAVLRMLASDSLHPLCKASALRAVGELSPVSWQATSFIESSDDALSLLEGLTLSTRPVDQLDASIALTLERIAFSGSTLAIEKAIALVRQKPAGAMTKSAIRYILSMPLRDDVLDIASELSR